MSSEQRDDMRWCQFIDGVYGPVYSFVRWVCIIFPERGVPERYNRRVAFQEGRRAIHPAFQCWSCIGVRAATKSSWHPLIEELLKSEDVPGGIYSSRTLLCWFFFSFPRSPYDAEEAESQLGSPGVVSESPSDMVDMYCTVVLLCILLSGRAYSEPTRRNFVMGVFALHRFMQILCSRLL